MFTDKELDRDTGTRVYVFNRFAIGNSGNTSNELDYRVSLKLPRISKALQFSLESNSKEKLQGEDSEDEINPVKNEDIEDRNQAEANLSYFDKIKGFADVKTSSGVVLSNNPEPFVKVDFSRDDQFENFKLTSYSRNNYYLEDKYSQSLGFVISKDLENQKIVRLFGVQSWDELSNVFAFTWGPTLYKRLSEISSMTYDLRLDYNDRQGFDLVEIRLAATYRRKLYKDWLYMNTGPFVSLPREDSFTQNNGAFIKVEAAFGDF